MGLEFQALGTRTGIPNSSRVESFWGTVPDLGAIIWATVHVSGIVQGHEFCLCTARSDVCDKVQPNMRNLPDLPEPCESFQAAGLIMHCTRTTAAKNGIGVSGSLGPPQRQQVHRQAKGPTSANSGDTCPTSFQDGLAQEPDLQSCMVRIKPWALGIRVLASGPFEIRLPGLLESGFWGFRSPAYSYSDCIRECIKSGFDYDTLRAQSHEQKPPTSSRNFHGPLSARTSSSPRVSKLLC